MFFFEDSFIHQGGSMFPDSLSLPSVGRLTRVALGLCVLGGGISFAQDRGAPQSRSVDRPTVDRPILDRQTMDRRTSDRPTMDRPNVQRQEMPRQVNRPTASDSAPVRPATNAIIAPPGNDQWINPPSRNNWEGRDLMAVIQSMARRGFIAVHPIGEDVDEFSGVSDFPAGWISYGFRVPPGEKLHLRLNHSNEGWFRMAMTGKWGNIEKGMLQNLIPTGNPEVSYTNFTKEPRSVYVIVDDPGWMSRTIGPFKVKVTRSWDPAKKQMDNTPIVTGIWAQKKEEPRPEPAIQNARTEAKVEVQPKG
jgi:hypothetical protein